MGNQDTIEPVIKEKKELYETLSKRQNLARHIQQMNEDNGKDKAYIQENEILIDGLEKQKNNNRNEIDKITSKGEVLKGLSIVDIISPQRLKEIIDHNLDDESIDTKEEHIDKAIESISPDLRGESLRKRLSDVYGARLDVSCAIVLYQRRVVDLTQEIEKRVANRDEKIEAYSTQLQQLVVAIEEEMKRAGVEPKIIAEMIKQIETESENNSTEDIVKTEQTAKKKRWSQMLRRRADSIAESKHKK